MITPTSSCGPGIGRGRGHLAGNIAEAKVSDGETESAVGPLPPPADRVPLTGQVERVSVFEVEVLHRAYGACVPLETARRRHHLNVLTTLELRDLNVPDPGVLVILEEMCHEDEGNMRVPTKSILTTMLLQSSALGMYMCCPVL